MSQHMHVGCGDMNDIRRVVATSVVLWRHPSCCSDIRRVVATSVVRVVATFVSNNLLLKRGSCRTSGATALEAANQAGAVWESCEVVRWSYAFGVN